MIVGLIFLLTLDNSEKMHSSKKMFKFNRPTIIHGLEARQVPSFLLLQLVGFLQTPRICREIKGWHQILEFCNKFWQKWLSLAEPVRVCSPSTLMPPTSSTHFGYECVEQNKGSEEMNGSNKRKRGGNNCCTILVICHVIKHLCFILWLHVMII